MIPVLIRLIRVLLLVAALVGLIWFLHGAQQVGIVNDWLILDGDAWNDPSKGMAFLVAGGVLMIVGVVVAASVLIGRQLRNQQDRLDELAHPPLDRSRLP